MHCTPFFARDQRFNRLVYDIEEDQSVGKVEGKAEGKLEEKLEIARSRLVKAMALALVAEVTGLRAAEIAALAES